MEPSTAVEESFSLNGQWHSLQCCILFFGGAKGEQHAQCCALQVCYVVSLSPRIYGVYSAAVFPSHFDIYSLLYPSASACVLPHHVQHDSFSVPTVATASPTYTTAATRRAGTAAQIDLFEISPPSLDRSRNNHRLSGNSLSSSPQTHFFVTFSLRKCCRRIRN